LKIVGFAVALPTLPSKNDLLRRLLQNPRFHLLLLTFNPYGVDIVKRITPLASCFHPRCNLNAIELRILIGVTTRDYPYQINELRRGNLEWLPDTIWQ